MSNFIFKPLGIIQDKRLTPLEQDYLCLIAQLQKASGCTASNNYFARYFGVKKQSAQGVIGRLEQKDFIKRTEKKHGGKTIERTIEIIDEVGRQILLSDGRKSSAGLAGKSVGVGRKPPTHTIDTTTDKTETASLKKSSSRIDWQAISKYNTELEKAQQR